MSDLEFIGAMFILILVLLICIIGLYLVFSGKLRSWVYGKLYDIFHFIGGKVNKNNSTNIPSDSQNISYMPMDSLSGYELKYEYDDVFLALSDQFDSSHVIVGAVCVLVREFENQYDANAVAVYCQDKKIGYLKKGRLQDMYHDFIDRDEKVTASISKIEDVGFSANIYINLRFYK